MNLENLNSKLKIKCLPPNVWSLALKPNSSRTTVSAEIKIDSDREHLELHAPLEDDFYDEYLMTASYSEKMQKHQEYQAEKIKNFYIQNNLKSNPPKTFIEVGCGDGSFMIHAKKFFQSVKGLEPSKPFYEECLKKGLQVINQYMPQNGLKEKFDCFASRQVFEHLDSPEVVLKGIFKSLNNDAIGLIEVPNGARSVSMNRHYDFFPDHVQHYSVKSLVSLAHRSGFSVLSCNPSFNNDYLELWIQKKETFERNVQEMIINRNEYINYFADSLSDLAKSNKKISIWGCGAKTITLLASIPVDILNKLEFIYDSDINKHYKYIPGSNLQIIPPNKFNENSHDYVLILALSYIEEIANTIREFCQETKILIPSKSGLIIDLKDN